MLLLYQFYCSKKVFKASLKPFKSTKIQMSKTDLHVLNSPFEDTQTFFKNFVLYKKLSSEQK